MNVSEWQKRLADNFSSNGVIGEKLMNIIELESAFGLPDEGLYRWVEPVALYMISPSQSNA